MKTPLALRRKADELVALAVELRELADEIERPAAGTLTVAAVAADLGCSPRAVYDLIQCKRLPAIRLGDGRGAGLRIARADLDAFKRNRRTTTEQEARAQA